MGNIQSLQQTGTNAFTRLYEYGAGTNILDEITDNDSPPNTLCAFIYDTNGNLIQSNTERHYQWDAADQLKSFHIQTGISEPSIYAQYLYDGRGNRTKKIVRTTGGNYEVTVYIDGVFEYCKKVSGSTYEKNYYHIMDGAQRIAQQRVGAAFPGDISDVVTYVLGDFLGSSNVRLNTSGGLIDREEYYPFGDSSLRTFTSKRYRYVGREKDQESGLYYYGARYYASWTCRFISVDPLAAKFAQLSPYNYADNNPISDLDIDGMQSTQTQPSAQGGGGSTPETNPSLCGPTLPDIDIVRKGEGPAAVAERNNISLDTLAKSNPNVFKNYDGSNEYWKNENKNWIIHPGQTLNIQEKDNLKMDLDATISAEYQELLLQYYDAIAGVDQIGGMPVDNIKAENSGEFLLKIQEDDSSSGQMAGALALGWSIGFIEPTPAGEVIMALATSVSIYWLGSEVITKMEKEIERLSERSPGPSGIQYSLRAVTDGYYNVYSRGSNTPTGKIWLQAGEVWKFGETTSSERYDPAYLASQGVALVPEFYGSQTEIKIVEKMKIYNYAIQNGRLPPGNKITR